MDLNKLEQANDCTWRTQPHGTMRTPAVFYASRHLIQDMDIKACKQACNVATLPGTVTASFAMPDAHWG